MSDRRQSFHPLSLSDCTLCPRMCHVDRGSGAKGYCGASGKLRVARAALHDWEEPSISSVRGSGTVFFSHCSLRCAFCQNESIAAGGYGEEIPPSRLAKIFLSLQDAGAHNVNLVTPTHYVPLIIEALEQAQAKGLVLPVVYNTSGYENQSVIEALNGYVDVYLTDFKYWSPAPARWYSRAADYPRIAQVALDTMVDQVGDVVFSDDAHPVLVRGVLVRHLLLPQGLEDAKRIVRYVHNRFGNRIRLSLMNQYTPQTSRDAFPDLASQVSSPEYEALLDFADELGVEDYYWQSGDAASSAFIPAFDGTGV